ncbi:MAG TPA: protein kinase [Thermoanaerobaculia bacterium]
MRTNIGQYRIEAPLGRGGMGVVYRGLHENLGRPVAIKALAPELTQQPEFKERFFSEAKTQARLQHPNIVAVYDLLEEGGEFFIVMEFVQGEPLDDRLRALAGTGMHLAEAIGVFSQVLAALDYAHSEGVIHRDIKPSNVLIAPGGRAKLMDFGIALLIGDKRLTSSQSTIGTPIYMSPEQIMRPRSVDHRSDIYSAAVVFFEMLAGRPPFDDETEYAIKKLHVEAAPPDLATLRPDLPAGIAQALAAALSKNPDDRFPSAGAFLRALQLAAPQLEIPAGATPPPQPAYRPTVLDDTRGTGRAPVPVAPSTGAMPPAVPGLAQPPRTNLLQGNNRWLVLGIAAILVLAIGFGGVFVLLRAFGGEESKVAENVPAEPASAAPAPVLQSPQVAAIPAAGQGVPLVAQAAPPTGQIQPVQQAAVPQPAQPSPVRPELRETRTSRKPEPVQAAAPLPAPAVAEPASAPPAPAPSPEPEEAPAGNNSETGATIDRLNQMNDVIVNLERLSEQSQEAHEEEGGEGALAAKLEAFSEATVALRKEFRKVTGTGIGGMKENVKGIFKRNRGGREGDTRVLEVKAQDLVRRGDEITGMIDVAGPTVKEYWREVRSNLKRLDSFFR